MIGPRRSASDRTSPFRSEDGKVRNRGVSPSAPRPRECPLTEPTAGARRRSRELVFLPLWQACWAPGKVSFAGRYFSFSNMHVSPKPVQQPHPPIWIGGASDAALRRAARFAAVWQPTPLPVAQLVERRAALGRACEAIGREPIPTRMSFRIEFGTITGNAPAAGKERPTGHGTPAEVAADLLRYREAAGLEAFQINFHGNRDLDQLLQSMECFMREVGPRLA